MAGEATIWFTGFVQKDPELRFMPNGDAVCNITVKVTPRTKKNGEWGKGEPSWYRVAVWRAAAEAVAEHVRADDRVLVAGALEMTSFEKDGVKRSIPEVTAEAIGVIPKMQKPEASQSKQNDQGDPW
jgi:single-strand DNA-binding protein